MGEEIGLEVVAEIAGRLVTGLQLRGLSTEGTYEARYSIESIAGAYHMRV